MIATNEEYFVSSTNKTKNNQATNNISATIPAKKVNNTNKILDKNENSNNDDKRNINYKITKVL